MPQHPAVILLHGGTPGGKDDQYVEVTAELLTRGGWDVLAIRGKGRRLATK